VTVASAPHLGAEAPAVPMSAVIATVIGNWFEFFDFVVYTFFAVMIGKQFFPTQSEYGSLLYSVGTFGVGFFTRPLGGLVIGAYADRAGRRAALTLTIMLMALGTGLLGVTPSYATIGIAAPCIVVLARLIQGFSSGGELGPATTYLLEAAPPGRRAALTAWQAMSQLMAAIVGSALGLLLSVMLSQEQLYEWGWRVPFLLGILIGPVGMYIRRQLPETIAEGEKHGSAREVLSHLFSGYSGSILLGILIICGPTVSVYVGNYFTSYAVTTLHLSASVGLASNVLSNALAIVGIAIGAWAADRIGRKPVMIWPRLVFIVIVYPAYLLITKQGATTETVLLANAVLGFLLGLATGSLFAILPEAFPKAARSSGLSILYAISVTVFGGTTQFVVTWLIETTGNRMVPAWYMIAANLVTIVGVLLIQPHREPEAA
jgi:MFS family permease